MKSSQIIRIYQILAVVLTIIFPFTGIIALSKTIQANSMLKVDKMASDKYLSEAYKWLIISSFACISIFSFSVFALAYIYLDNENRKPPLK